MKAWVIGILLVLFVAIGWYFYTGSQTEETPAPPPPAEVIQEVPAPVVIEEEPVEEFVEQPEPPEEPEPVVEEEPLPPLQDSDTLAAESLGSLVGVAMAERYFASEDMISRMVTTVDALSSSQVPGAIQAVQGPEGDFGVTVDDQPDASIVNEEGDPIPQFLSDPANERRYLVYVEMLEAMDTGQLVQLYQRQYPLFQEAWRQLGYADGDFNQRMLAVIDELLATPEVEGPLRLKKPEAYYLFSDDDLESLSAGQKILLRMGSENAARVKAKLSEIRQALLNAQ
jgi:hypothetical protein